MITDHTSWFPCAIYIQGFQCLHAFVFGNYFLLELVCRWPHLILKFTWQISSLIQCHNVTLREDCCDNLIPMECALWKNRECENWLKIGWKRTLIFSTRTKKKLDWKRGQQVLSSSKYSHCRILISFSTGNAFRVFNKPISHRFSRPRTNSLGPNLEVSKFLPIFTKNKFR